jgi:ribosomal protein L7/L12
MTQAKYPFPYFTIQDLPTDMVELSVENLKQVVKSVREKTQVLNTTPANTAQGGAWKTTNFFII